MSMQLQIQNPSIGIPTTIIIVDSVKRTRISCAMKSMMILDVNGLYFIDHSLSQNPIFCGIPVLGYPLQAIEGLFVVPEVLDRLAFRFKKTNHEIIVHAKDNHMMLQFLQMFTEILGKKNILVKSLQNIFQTDFNQYMTGIPNLDSQRLDIANLNKLMLENIILPSGPFKMDQTFVTYLSLSGSSFKSISQQNSFWDWIVTSIGEKVTCLVLNNMKLKILPFDIIFMKNLQILSVANNDLIFLPHFIGELDNLDSLYINNNKLTFLPGCVQKKIFRHLNITYNDISSPMICYPLNCMRRYKGEIKYRCKTLCDISLCSLINNNVSLSRKDIPYTLWTSLYSFSRCAKCHAILMTDRALEIFDDQYVKTFNIMIPSEQRVPIQFFECLFRCPE